MRHTAAVYGRSLAAHVKSTMEYPADFWIMASSGALWQVLQFAFISVLFANITTVAGWGYHEMLILAGFLGLSGGSSALFWDGIWSTPSMIVKGELDYRIVRPAPVMVQVASSHIGMQSFGEVTLSSAMLVLGWTGAGLGLDMLPLALLLLACACVIQCALLTAMCAIGFWVKGHFPAFAWIAVDLQRDVMRFPLGIYPPLVRLAATFMLPFAFASFVPVQILMGRLPAWWMTGTIAVTVVMVGIAVAVFRAGLRSYDSAGH
ncbi:ABC-2 family transporter protein [Glycomyces sp. L485]|uniref:ABC transporter permease n=1 Tax=Glycomyces sp. L485 TaxID=2909235 RepID=UPI001F4A97BA|nr:ABC-2 family transporter protein [Glycomyces sp. L485]MCH7230136.1 ABC-2 family transporter protein [Glycomyces sp. L485]